MTANKTDTVRSAVMKMMNRHCGTFRIEACAWTVEEIMSRNPLRAVSDDGILETTSPRGLKNFRRIPVVGMGKSGGIVSIGGINHG